MRESRLENELAQAEAVYDDLIQYADPSGPCSRETLRRVREGPRGVQYHGEISPLIRQTDLTRTELRHQLLTGGRGGGREVPTTAEEAEKAARSHEQARKAIH